MAKFQGGGAFNVIPDSVTIGGTFRAFSKESFAQLRQRIEEVHPTLGFSASLDPILSWGQKQSLNLRHFPTY